MEKQWRPADWDIMNYCSVEEQMESPLMAMHFFEIGADAMLVYLKSQEHEDWLATEEGQNSKGAWYYIPDE